MAQIATRQAPYKDFLQPALQRRFVVASGVALILAYLEAVAVGSWQSFIWAWFPIPRCFLFFICALSIVLLRISHLHLGVSTTRSPIGIAIKALRKAKSYEIIATYCLFGWLFGQIYLWSAGSCNGLQWIYYPTTTQQTLRTHHAMHALQADRPRLNERPIVFSTYFATLGLIHALFHIVADLDSLRLDIVETHTDSKSDSVKIVSMSKLVNSELPAVITQAVLITVSSLVTHMLLYGLFLRKMAWSWALVVMRSFYNLPKSNMLPHNHPFHIWLLFRMALIGFLLSLLWAGTNAAFTLCLKTHPIKHGKPLTSESKDPNGSLLNGLTSKKLSSRCFAMWELAFIARDFKDRRRSIFEDIDRKGGSMWEQVCHNCLSLISGVGGNVQGGDIVASPPNSTPDLASVQARRKSSIQPSMSNRLGASRHRDESSTQVGHKQVSDGQISEKLVMSGKQLAPVVSKAVDKVKSHLFSQDQQALAPATVQPLSQYIATALNTPVGQIFRSDRGLRMAQVAFGQDEVEVSYYVNAATALSQLAVHSLVEDTFGQVQHDMANIIRTFGATIMKLEALHSKFPESWLDANESKADDVGTFIESLKMGLRSMLATFDDYIFNLGLSNADVRAARTAAGLERKSATTDEVKS